MVIYLTSHLGRFPFTDGYPYRIHFAALPESEANHLQALVVHFALGNTVKADVNTLRSSSSRSMFSDMEIDDVFDGHKGCDIEQLPPGAVLKLLAGEFFL